MLQTQVIVEKSDRSDVEVGIVAGPFRSALVCSDCVLGCTALEGEQHRYFTDLGKAFRHLMKHYWRGDKVQGKVLRSIARTNYKLMKIAKKL